MTEAIIKIKVHSSLKHIALLTRCSDYIRASVLCEGSTYQTDESNESNHRVRSFTIYQEAVEYFIKDAFMRNIVSAAIKWLYSLEVTPRKACGSSTRGAKSTLQIFKRQTPSSTN